MASENTSGGDQQRTEGTTSAVSPSARPLPADGLPPSKSPCSSAPGDSTDGVVEGTSALQAAPETAAPEAATAVAAGRGQAAEGGPGHSCAGAGNHAGAHPCSRRALKTIHINLAACKYSVCECLIGDTQVAGVCCDLRRGVRDTSCAQPFSCVHAVRVVTRKLGWVEVGDDASWEVCWTDTSSGTDRLMRLHRPQVPCLLLAPPPLFAARCANNFGLPYGAAWGWYA